MQSASVLERARPAEPVGHTTSPRPRTTTADILLIDGRPLLRECLARALQAEWPEGRVTTTGWDDLAPAASAASYGLCLASLDGKGTAALADIAGRVAGAALVVLSDDDSYGSIAAAAGHGARGYFSTAAGLGVLVQGLRLVLVGGTAMPVPVSTAPAVTAPPAPAARSVSRFSADLFTPKELEVLGSLAGGRQNKLIAHELMICETTVKVHLRHIFRKLGTTNRTHAALLAREMLAGPGD